MRTWSLLNGDEPLHTGTYDACIAYVKANARDLAPIGRGLRMTSSVNALTTLTCDAIRSVLPVDVPRVQRIVFGKRGTT